MKKIALLMASIFSLGAQANTVEPEKYIAQSFSGLKNATEAHSSSWGLGSEKHWSVDLNLGKVRFDFSDGKVAEAPVQIIGTYSPNGTFMWGWEHPSVPSELSEHANFVKTFGHKYQLSELVTHVVKLSEERAWEYTALAMRLGKANGAYRADAGGGTQVYMTFGEITLSNSELKKQSK
ncbi:hypothetical protein MHO82_06050 [Vibrio sp. Of7-15]|uniref:DUF6882 domain-containing protein n=1 Tax=Vibrio sp. Of7-15 TaxID=2724879 RepID=UPI001EF35818|nr:DUF6882 domain-containing protein [Vibrio sp. Of7-15]MCG7496417.1 hypothetical protein [Vibrio sp. Of7-15]